MEDDPLGFGVCPTCGYALAGLPSEGTCPECGSAYDRAYTVLPAWRPGEGGRLLGLPVVAAVFVGRWWYGRGRVAQLVYGAVFAAVAVGLRVWSAASRTADSPLHLWLSPDGFAVRTTVPDDALIRRAWRWAPWAAGRVFVAFAVCSTIADPGRGCGFVAVAAMVAFGVWYYRANRQRPPTTVAAPRPGVPDLIAWSAATGVSLDRRRPTSRCHLTLVRKTYNGTMPLADVLLDLTPPAAAELAARIMRWRGG